MLLTKIHHCRGVSSCMTGKKSTLTVEEQVSDLIITITVYSICAGIVILY